MTPDTPSDSPARPDAVPRTDRCQTWGYYTGRRCELRQGHKGGHRLETVTEPLAHEFMGEAATQPEPAPLDVLALMRAIRWHEHPDTEPVRVRSDHLAMGGYLNDDCGSAIAAAYRQQPDTGEPR